MADRQSIDVGGWLELGQAARYLGVHFTTLRRWADAGEVPCSRTPGGRRRFREQDLRLFLERMRQAGAGTALVALQERTVALARHHMEEEAVQRQGWVARFDDESRSRFRSSGQRLIGLLLQFTGSGNAGIAYLEEARRIAHEHGTVCRDAGVSITDTVGAVLFFRHSLLEVAYEAGVVSGLNDSGSRRLYQRMSDFLDAVLLAAAEGYSGSAPAALVEDRGGGYPCG